MRRQVLLVALLLVTIGIGASQAGARNDSGARTMSAYWFYQGYLSGSVHKYVVCCNTINKGRISYECSGYSENASYIRINGSWENYSTQFYCDTIWNVNVTWKIGAWLELRSDGRMAVLRPRRTDTRPAALRARSATRPPCTQNWAYPGSTRPTE